MAPFLLLRLPFLTITDVLEQMKLIEVFELSQTSKKVHNIVRRVYHRIPIDMFISLTKSVPLIRFFVKRQLYLFCDVCDFEKPSDLNRIFGGITVNTSIVKRTLIVHCGRIVTYWGEEMRGLEIMLNHFLDLFTGLRVNLELQKGPEEHKLVVLRVIKERNFKLRVFKLEMKCCDDDLYEKFVEIGQNAKKFIVKPEPFKPELRMGLPLVQDYFRRANRKSL